MASITLMVGNQGFQSVNLADALCSLKDHLASSSAEVNGVSGVVGAASFHSGE